MTAVSWPRTTSAMMMQVSPCPSAWGMPNFLRIVHHRHGVAAQVDDPAA
jgi:hypothetical protein